MRITYDRLADALYVLLRDDAQADETVEISGTVSVDVDADSQVIGFEVLNVRALLGDEPLRSVVIETVSAPEEVMVLPEAPASV